MPLHKGYGLWIDYAGGKYTGSGIYGHGNYHYLRYGIEVESFQKQVYRNEIYPKLHEEFKTESLIFTGMAAKNAGILWGAVGKGHEWLAFYRSPHMEISLRYRYGDLISKTVSIGSRGDVYFGLRYSITEQDKKERVIGFYAGAIFSTKHVRLRHTPLKSSRLYLFRSYEIIQNEKEKKKIKKRIQQRHKITVVFSRNELLKKEIPLRYVLLIAGKKYNKKQFFKLLKRLPRGVKGKVYKLYLEKIK